MITDSSSSSNKAANFTHSEASQFCTLPFLRGAEPLGLSLCWLMFLQKRDAPTHSSLISSTKIMLSTVFILFYTYQLFSYPLENRLQTWLNALNLGSNFIQLIEIKQKENKKVNR
ncbi:MAG: hypothetical protein AB4041_11575 [Microcystaceae cyanobacterium]